MTPDEVVKQLNFPKKKEHSPNNTTTEKHIIIGYNHCVDDCQPLIQDYQKLRERVSVEKIRIVINERLKNFPINEDMDGLSSRGVDYQNLLNRTSQQIVTYLQQPTEH
jgi:hypothetical protein